MRTIHAGSVDTYAGLAKRAGNPQAVRAAGTVCSTNMVAPFVPCHRVLAADGLGGYAYGLEVKIALLEHEGVLL
jgi:methylated-DNA-[protein]-cysteine S-methyltransferase